MKDPLHSFRVCVTHISLPLQRVLCENRKKRSLVPVTSPTSDLLTTGVGFPGVPVGVGELLVVHPQVALVHQVQAQPHLSVVALQQGGQERCQMHRGEMKLEGCCLLVA